MISRAMFAGENQAAMAAIDGVNPSANVLANVVANIPGILPATSA